MKKHLRVTVIFVESQGKVLVLRRNKDDAYGDTWSLPAGKAKQEESELSAGVRELKEETGFTAEPNQLRFVTTLDWSYPEYDITFSVFHVVIEQTFAPQLVSEIHSEHVWMTPKEFCAQKNLIEGTQEMIRAVYPQLEK